MYLDPKIGKEIGNRVFPQYSGRMFRLTVQDGSQHPMNLHSYWDGGSRDYYLYQRFQRTKRLGGN